MEGDDDDSDCWKTYKVSGRPRCIVIHCARANPPRHLFEGGVYFTQRLQLCGVYSRAVSIRGNTVFTNLLIACIGLHSGIFRLKGQRSHTS